MRIQLSIRIHNFDLGKIRLASELTQDNCCVSGGLSVFMYFTDVSLCPRMNIYVTLKDKQRFFYKGLWSQFESNIPSVVYSN
jgi:hypothetical protein